MIENERRPDEFIELKIEKETRFEKLKREFENNQNEFEFVELSQGRNMYEYVNEDKKIRVYNDVLEFEVQDVDDTLFEKVFPLSNYHMVYAHEGHYVMVNENRVKHFMCRDNMVRSRLLGMQVEQSYRYIYLTSIHEYHKDNKEAFKHLNMIKFDKKGNKQEKVNIIFRHPLLLQRERVFQIVSRWQKNIQFYLFTKCDAESNMKILYFTLKDAREELRMSEHTGQGVQYYEMREVKSKYFQLQDNEKVIKIKKNKDTIYLITSEEVYVLEKNEKTHSINSQPLNVLYNIHNHNKKPLLTKWLIPQKPSQHKQENIRDAQICAHGNNTVMVLSNTHHIYWIVDGKVEESLNLPQKILYSGNGVQFRKIALLDNYLVVTAKQNYIRTLSRQLISQKREYKNGIHIFKKHYNSLSYCQYMQLNDFQLDDQEKYLLKVVKGSAQVLLQQLYHRNMIHKIRLSLINVGSIKTNNSQIVYEPQITQQKIYASSACGLTDLTLIMNKHNMENQYEAVLIIQNHKEYKYSSICTRKELPLNCSNFRQPVNIAIDPYSFNIFLAMKETIILCREFQNNIISINQLYLPGVKFAQFQSDGSSLVISTSQMVYVLNPWLFRIQQQFKIVGRVLQMKVREGIIMVLHSTHSKQRFMQIIMYKYEKASIYSIDLNPFHRQENQYIFSCSYGYFLLAYDHVIRVYDNRSHELFAQLQISYDDVFGEYASTIEINEELGFMLIGTSLGNIKQFHYPINEHKLNHIQVNSQSICEHRIVGIQFNRQTLKRLKIKTQKGSIMHYNISQYLEGRKLKKPKIISKTLKKRLISSKFNIMKNHEIIPKNHLSHLDKIIEQSQINYQTSINISDEEKKKNSVEYNRDYEHLKEEIKLMFESYKQMMHKEKIINLRTLDKIKKNHRQSVKILKGRVMQMQEKNIKQIKDRYKVFDVLQQKYRERDRELGKQKVKLNQKLKAQETDYQKKCEANLKQRENEISMGRAANQKQRGKSEYIKEEVGKQTREMVLKILDDAKEEYNFHMHQAQNIQLSSHLLQKNIDKLKEKISTFDLVKMEMEMQINEIRKRKEEKDVLNKSLQCNLQTKANEKYIQYLFQLEDQDRKRKYESTYLKKEVEGELQDEQAILLQLKYAYKQLSENVKRINDEIIRERNQKINNLIDVQAKHKQIKELKLSRDTKLGLRVYSIIKLKTMLQYLIQNFMRCLKKGQQIELDPQYLQNQQYLKDFKEFLVLIKERLAQKRIYSNVKGRNYRLYSQGKKINPMNKENQIILAQFNHLKKQSIELRVEINKFRQKKSTTVISNKTRSQSMFSGNAIPFSRLNPKKQKTCNEASLLKKDQNNSETKSYNVKKKTQCSIRKQNKMKKIIKQVQPRKQIKLKL